AFTSRCAPLSWLVTMMMARRAARSSLRVFKRSSFTKTPPRTRRKWIPPQPLLHLFDEHPDLTAARQSDLPRGLVGDADLQRLRLAALDHVDRLGDHRSFDAAAGHRAQKIALIVDHQVRADRSRRRAPGLDHGGERHAAARLFPVLGGFQ